MPQEWPPDTDELMTGVGIAVADYVLKVVLGLVLLGDDLVEDLFLFEVALKYELSDEQTLS